MNKTKHIAATITRALNDSTRTIEAVVSTDSIDRYGEIVEQSWRLDNFKANPIVLFAHDPREPIGRADSIKVIDGKLRATIRIAPTTRGNEVYDLFKAEILKTFSVGFKPGNVRTEKRDGRDVRILSNNEMLEISAVAIPANTDAVAIEVRSLDGPSMRLRDPRHAERWSDLSVAELHELAHTDPARFVRLLDVQREARHAKLTRHPQYAGEF